MAVIWMAVMLSCVLGRIRRQLRVTKEMSSAFVQWDFVELYEYCDLNFFLRGAYEQKVRQVLLCMVANRAAGRRRIFIGDPPDPIP